MGFFITLHQSPALSFGLSIVICSYNGVERLLNVLDHINYLIIPEGLDYEVLMVDNASTDGTTDWLNKTSVSSNWKFKLSVISESKQGLNFARLTGVRNARFDWILFCDDDNLLDSQYLQFWHYTIDTFSDVGAVGGCGIPILEIPVPDWFNRYKHSYAVGSQQEKTDYLKHGESLYGAGMFILKTPVLGLLDRGFNMVMSDRNGGKLCSGGDLEWCYLLQLSGWKLYYHEKMIFHHQIATSRLLWSYYVNLKSGIASGAGLLFTYQFIFKYGTQNAPPFLLSYLYQAIKSLSVYIYASIKLNLFFNHISKYENKLALAILKSKASSYFDNLNAANMHYKKMKRIFSAAV
jgi:glycosyltransferase involved in cell wall biosynthesis